MNIENMNLYCMVYEMGNIARVAESQFMSHQAVSKRIRAIEKELGVVLFDRSVKGITPTKAGQDVYRTFNTMLASYRKLQNRLEGSGSERPVIRLAIEFYNIDIINLESILAFEQTSDLHPQIQVRYLSNMECYRSLLAGRIDLALTNRPFLNPEKFEFISLNKSRAFFAISENNPLATKKVLEPADFDGQTFFSIIDADNTNHAIISKFEDAGVNVAVDEVAYDMGSLASMVQSNRGFHVLPEVYTAPLDARAGIVTRVLPGFRDVFEIGIVRARQRSLHVAVDTFVDFLHSNHTLFR